MVVGSNPTITATMLLASIPFDSGLFGTVWFESTLNIEAANKSHLLMGSSPLTSTKLGDTLIG